MAEQDDLILALRALVAELRSASHTSPQAAHVSTEPVSISGNPLLEQKRSPAEAISGYERLNQIIKENVSEESKKAIVTKEATDGLVGYVRKLRDAGIGLETISKELKGAAESSKAMQRTYHEVGKNLLNTSRDVGQTFKDVVGTLKGGGMGSLVKGLMSSFATGAVLSSIGNAIKQPFITAVQAGAMGGPGLQSASELIAGPFKNAVNDAYISLYKLGYSTNEASAAIYTMARLRLGPAVAGEAGMMSRITGMDTGTIGTTFQTLSRRFATADKDLAPTFSRLITMQAATGLSTEELNNLFQTLSTSVKGTSKSFDSIGLTMLRYGELIQKGYLTQGEVGKMTAATQQMPFPKIAGILGMGGSKDILGDMERLFQMDASEQAKEMERLRARALKRQASGMHPVIRRVFAEAELELPGMRTNQASAIIERLGRGGATAAEAAQMKGQRLESLRNLALGIGLATSPGIGIAGRMLSGFADQFNLGSGAEERLKKINENKERQEAFYTLKKEGALTPEIAAKFGEVQLNIRIEHDMNKLGLNSPLSKDFFIAFEKGINEVMPNIVEKSRQEAATLTPKFTSRSGTKVYSPK